MSIGPVFLPVNQIDHFYLGGDNIGLLRRGPGGPRRPEEWLGSTVARFGEKDRGVTVLANGENLRELVTTDPNAWLGPDHVERYGSNSAILVKLLDAGERLPVHVHPSRRFAKDHLDCDYGKTEAWVVLQTPPEGASVWVGCNRDVDPLEMRSLVDAQNKPALVALLNQITVFAGDAVLVPSGTPHCTGAGAFVLELQEPTDFSILLEWEGFALDGPKEGHVNLGFDEALQCVNRKAFSQEYLTSLVRHNGALPRLGQHTMMPSLADPYFRTVRVHTDATHTTSVTLDASFAVVLVTEGSGCLSTPTNGNTIIRRGDALVVPWAAGQMEFSGDLTVLVSLPPAPDAPEPIEFDGK
jgi:mannose-6-phosphate isomerase